MPAAPARPHTDAVVAALEAAGLLVGRGKKPPGSGWQGEAGESEHVPYVVLFPWPGSTDGNLADPHEYLDYTFQTTCTAATQEGAEAVIDIVKATLIGVRLAVVGRSSYPVYPLLDLPVRRDDQIAPPVHYSVAQFRVRTQPA